MMVITSRSNSSSMACRGFGGDHLILSGAGAGRCFEENKFQDPILPEKDIQDRGKCFSTLNV